MSGVLGFWGFGVLGQAAALTLELSWGQVTVTQVTGTARSWRFLTHAHIKIDLGLDLFGCFQFLGPSCLGGGIDLAWEGETVSASSYTHAESGAVRAVSVFCGGRWYPPL